MLNPNDVSALAPEFMKFTQEVLFDDVWKRPELSPRDRSLITVTVLASMSKIEQIDFHLNRALDNGLTTKELVAALTHIAFYAGWPSAMTGLTHLKAILDQRARS